MLSRRKLVESISVACKNVQINSPVYEDVTGPVLGLFDWFHCLLPRKVPHELMNILERLFTPLAC